MAALDAVAAQNAHVDKPKPKRKASEHSSHGHGHVVHTTAHRAHSHHSHAHGHGHTAPKSSRSETHLPRLSRTPSSSGVSAVTSESSNTGGSSRRPAAAGGHRTRSAERVQVEVVEGGSGSAEAAEGADDGEWESGEETPAVGSRRLRSVSDPHKLRSTQQRKASAQSNATVESAATGTTGDGGSPLELGSMHSPGHEPPATRKTTGFPAPSDSQTSLPSAASTSAVSGADGIPAAAALPSPPHTSSEEEAVPRADSAPLSEPLPPVVAAESVPTASSDPAPVTTEQPAAPSGGFPFPRMVSDESAPQHVVRPHAVQHISHASQAISESPISPPQSVPSRLAESQTTQSSASAQSPAAHGPSSVMASAPRSRVISSHAPSTLRHRGSQQSLRSIQSLRAPPHPLNSPTGRSGFLHTNSPKEKRVSSLHYPPAAPAVVYRETVGGHGWDESQPKGRAEHVVEREEPPSPAPPPRTERVGSFSSVRSLKDLLAGTSTPPARAMPPPRNTSSRDPSRRLTAMQAASAVARLNTTSDPVAYHQSLGFSPQTAETAHLLSRFLPQRRTDRPKWAISAREAMATMEAAEEAHMRGEEIPEGRVGVTDGQYRDAHESLVATLRELGKAAPVRRGGASRSYSYHNLLGAVAEDPHAHRPGTGQTPFEISVARCVAQRPTSSLAY
ncbi:uncharacterized protein EHS24_002371 [Apiotrichum porosum]|uniref:Uncharacterized protein n=1 Tax=Apiotrichum porosum TaxID=105984 RepID=A0A427XIJ6_9TREE|nr:uncharacterized protein EHS24_002371 [Apiotrichum porosum]RSH78642.1 hypothetical protein EHS24_002371 [Apiotrichum porosum]